MEDTGKNKSNGLAKVQAYANIFASVMVPILIAVFGWLIQVKQSEEGAKKDYVQMALSILNNKDRAEDEELRQWAIKVLDETAPVPFTKGLKDGLAKGDLVIIPSVYRMPPAVFMDPPKPLKTIDPVEPGAKVNMDDLLKSAVENYGICNENSIRFEGLQELIRGYDKIYNKKEEL
ncbi:hypothetical protein MHL40_21530 [Pseudomonas luteola]|uniref:hypothetical protein n=1 Tax=Pseudomonas luteola TaxID=47886 RepID=UPI001EF666DE|nr:hypothetical protein [Pseudomonas luteola]MCG7375235.1 hypothetical protein [Pseudomonas luteola]